MMKFILIASLVLLSACAAKVASSSERTVVISAAKQDVAGAQVLANSECKKFQRSARLIRLPEEDRTFVFDCIP